MNVEIYRTCPEARIPTKATGEAAAYDIYAVGGPYLLHCDETVTISSGLIMRPPDGYHIRITGRSGWGRKYGIGIPHGMGIIDRDFCGPDDIIGVVLHRPRPYEKLGETISADLLKPITINTGDRIAQLTIEKTNIIEFDIITYPPSTTTRGGFGSTGTK